MEYKDYYDIMGIRKDAAQDEVKRAYRKLARKYHPDVSKEKDAEAKFKELGEAYEKTMAASIPLGRLGAPEEIAALVGFLCSDAAAYITGETVHVNGGMHMA